MGLRVVSGSVPAGAVVSCQLKRATGNNDSPGDGMTAALALTPSVTSSGWIFTGSPTQSETLKPGRYVADAKIVAAGKTTMTEPVIIEVLERVTS